MFGDTRPRASDVMPPIGTRIYRVRHHEPPSHNSAATHPIDHAGTNTPSS